MAGDTLFARTDLTSDAEPESSLTLMRLQNPIREGFDAVNEHLRAVSRVQKEFSKALDKVGCPF